jgi:hypothetical protein
VQGVLRLFVRNVHKGDGRPLGGGRQSAQEGLRASAWSEGRRGRPAGDGATRGVGVAERMARGRWG